MLEYDTVTGDFRARERSQAPRLGSIDQLLRFGARDHDVVHDNPTHFDDLAAFIAFRVFEATGVAIRRPAPPVVTSGYRAPTDEVCTSRTFAVGSIHPLIPLNMTSGTGKKATALVYLGTDTPWAAE